MNNIKNIFLEDEIINSYLNYAMNVIIGRALPDTRDGLKPVHRRTLFAMKELNNFFNKQYKKSARIVGDVIGKYHPHGETAVYDSIVRLAQNFLQRYPLIDGQGNFGSIDGDPAAAMRYTEIKMSKITEYLIKDLDFATIDFLNNYDNTQKYPSVLPNMFPNLLINGSYGIAVGMITNIPPHNLKEVLNGCLATIENKDITIEEIMTYIQGPDFPTYAIINNNEGIIKAYKTGKGKIYVKAKTFIEKNNDIEYIIIKEIPYQVNKTKLIEKIIFLIKEKKIEGIKTIKDESDKNGLRISIELIKNYEPKIILNNLYLQTKMQNILNINMISLVNNLPKLLNLKSIINYFINHRQEIIYKRTNFILKKIRNKFHIFEGLYIVLDNIKDIIDLITKSKNTTETKKIIQKKNFELNNTKKIYIKFIKTKLKKIYKFSKKQINSIFDIKLNKLTNIEKNKIINIYITLIKDLHFYTNLKKNFSYISETIKNELVLIKKIFSDKRKTYIIKNINNNNNNNNNNINIKDLINKEEIIIILSEKGYIKFKNLNEIVLQKRFKKGKTLIQLNKEDKIKKITITNTYSTLICISNFGKLYYLNVYDIKKSTKILIEIPIINFLKLDNNEKINLILSAENLNDYQYLIIITKKGIIKKILINKIKKNATKIILFNDDDEIFDAKLLKNDTTIMLFSSDGKTIKFKSNEIRCRNKKSYGIIGMKIKKEENLISLTCVENNYDILLLTENGFGKRTKIDDYPLHHRGGKGIICIPSNNKIGKLNSVETVNNNNDLFLITIKGILLRIKINEVPCTSRHAKGVTLIKLANNEKLANIKTY